MERESQDSNQGAAEFNRDVLKVRLQKSSLSSEALNNIIRVVIDDASWCIEDYYLRNAFEWTIILVREPEDAS